MRNLSLFQLITVTFNARIILFVVVKPISQFFMYVSFSTIHKELRYEAQQSRKTIAQVHRIPEFEPLNFQFRRKKLNGPTGKEDLLYHRATFHHHVWPNEQNTKCALKLLVVRVQRSEARKDLNGKIGLYIFLYNVYKV